MNFTILQSVYKKDNSEFLSECFNSIYVNTIQPEKIVLVKDGQLTEELNSVINSWKNKLPIKIVGYDNNHGLAYALKYGLQFVTTELVARMDSDDICYPDRFEKQINFFKLHPEISLLSGYIDEFNNTPDCIVSTRMVPLEHEKIIEYLKKRNAFNHMAVMFKKTAVINCGNYQEVPYFEDYDLWIRMVQSGYQTANLSEKLVKARIGNDMIGRRHGLAYAKHELFFLKKQKEAGFLSNKEYKKLCILKLPIRILPKKILKIIYKLLRIKSN